MLSSFNKKSSLLSSISLIIAFLSTSPCLASLVYRTPMTEEEREELYAPYHKMVEFNQRMAQLQQAQQKQIQKIQNAAQSLYEEAGPYERTNEMKAFNLYSKAAQLGHPGAIEKLKAFELHKQDQATAMLMYQNGLAAEEKGNYELAYQYFKRAAKIGLINAQEKIKAYDQKLAQNRESNALYDAATNAMQQGKTADAMNLFFRAGQLGNYSARQRYDEIMTVVTNMLTQAAQLEQTNNLQDALRIYTQLANMGNLTAQNKLLQLQQRKKVMDDAQEYLRMAQRMHEQGNFALADKFRSDAQSIMQGGQPQAGIQPTLEPMNFESESTEEAEPMEIEKPSKAERRAMAQGRAELKRARG